MWLLVLYQLMVAEDCRAYIDQRLEGVEYSAVPVGPGSYRKWFLKDAVCRANHSWASHWVSPELADCALAALGLSHMRFEVCDTGGIGGRLCAQGEWHVDRLVFYGLC